MHRLGRERFDAGSVQPERLMYKPTVPADRDDYEHHVLDGAPLPVEAVLLDEQVDPTVPPEPEPVEATAGDGPAYEDLSAVEQRNADAQVQRRVDGWRKQLAEAEDWPEGHRDDRDRGWERLLADAADTLAALAHSPWNARTLAEAEALYEGIVPEAMAEAVPGKWAAKATSDHARAGLPWEPVAGELDAVPEDTTPGGRLPDPSGYSDTFMAEWMAQHALGGRWCWAVGLGWMKWTGKRWKPSDDTAVREVVRRAVKRLFQELNDPANAKTVAGLLSSGRIGGITSLMRGVVQREADQFDTRPDLLNVGNGVVDLRTGELLPHDPELLLTKITRVAYVPGATHPDWDQALRALPPEVADWMQVRCGQAATGHPTPDDLMPVLQGGGSNGKSTFLGAQLRALGQHATFVPERVLLANPSDHPTELMTLRGARLAVIEETPEARHLNVKRLKATVGTPQMTARHIRQDSVTWDATHSLLLATNYRPRVDEVDHGTWRRLALVRFPHKFPVSDLRTRIERGQPQLEAVLAWIVAGAVRWHSASQVIPPPPAVVQHDTEDWRASADQVLAYVRERLVFDPEAAILTSDLLEAFNDWLASNGQKSWSDQTFADRFLQHQEVEGHVEKVRTAHLPAGFVRPHYRGDYKPRGRQRLYLGVRWRMSEEETDGHA
ncbi:DNA primase family protein, partial [Ruania rhizosphaerae]|uniref:DNA primase family protein n=1 Tax=Ruania rhizosphaerae TaxID=1840413 RepID=UPI00190F376E